MRRLIFICLILISPVVQCEDIEISITFPIFAGRLGSPTFELDANELEIVLDENRVYHIDIGGSVSMRDGKWKITKLTRSSRIDIIVAEPYANSIDDRWLMHHIYDEDKLPTFSPHMQYAITRGNRATGIN